MSLEVIFATFITCRSESLKSPERGIYVRKGTTMKYLGAEVHHRPVFRDIQPVFFSKIAKKEEAFAGYKESL